MSVPIVTAHPAASDGDDASSAAATTCARCGPCAIGTVDAAPTLPCICDHRIRRTVEWRICPTEVHRLLRPASTASPHDTAARHGLTQRSDRTVRSGPADIVDSSLRGVYRSPSCAGRRARRGVRPCVSADPYVAIAAADRRPASGRSVACHADQRIHVLAPPARNPVDRTMGRRPIAPAAIHRSRRRRSSAPTASGSRLGLGPRSISARFVGPTTCCRSSSRRCTTATSTETNDGAVAVDFDLAAAAVAHDVPPPVRPADAGGGPAESHPEVVVAELLRAAGVLGLVRQHQIDLPGYGPRDSTSPYHSCVGDRSRRASGATTRPVGRTSDRTTRRRRAAIGWTTTRIIARRLRARASTDARSPTHRRGRASPIYAVRPDTHSERCTNSAGYRYIAIARATYARSMSVTTGYRDIAHRTRARAAGVRVRGGGRGGSGRCGWTRRWRCVRAGLRRRSCRRRCRRRGRGRSPSRRS